MFRKIFTILILSFSLIEVTNAVTKPDLIVGPDTICWGSTAVVFNINTPIAGHTYQWTITNGASVHSFNTNQDTIRYTFNGFQGGPATISVRSDSSGIISDAVTKSIIIGPNPNKTFTTYSTCEGEDGIIQINSYDPEVTYFAYKSAVLASIAPHSKNGSPLYVSAGMLIPGKNGMTVRASIYGKCEVLLNHTDTIITSPKPNILTPTVDVLTDTICIGQDASIRINNSEGSMQYNVCIVDINNHLLNSDSISLANGSNILTTVDASKLSVAGKYRVFTIVRSNTSCSYYTLADNNDTLVIMPKPNLGLVLEHSADSICPGDTLKLKLKNPLSGFRYRYYKNSVPKSPYFLGGADIPYNFISDSLSVGFNNLSVWVESIYNGCYLSKISDTAKVKLQKTPIDTFSLTKNKFDVCNEQNTIQIQHKSEQGVTYTAFYKTTPVSIPMPGTGFSLLYNIASSMLDTGYNTVKIWGQVQACPKVSLADTLIVFRAKVPKTDRIVKGDTICPKSSAQISILNSEIGVKYRALKGVSIVSDTVMGNGGTIYLTIPNVNGSTFAQGSSSTIVIQAFINSCIYPLATQANIRVFKSPELFNTINGSKACLGDSSNITISNSEAIVEYRAYITGSAILCDNEKGNGGTLTLRIPASFMTSAITYNFTIIASTGEGICAPDTMFSKPNIDIIPYPNQALLLTADSVMCQGKNLNIKINNSETNVTYKAYNRLNKLITPFTTIGLNGTNPDMLIQRDSVKFIPDTITIRAVMQNKCTTNLSQKIIVWKKEIPLQNLTVSSNGIICEEDNGLVSLSNTELDVYYKIKLNGSLLPDWYKGNGNVLTISIDKTLLIMGDNPISIIAKRSVCDSVILANTTSIKVVRPDENTLVSDNTTCPGIDGHIDIYNTESGVSYQVFSLGGSAISGLVSGNNGETISIPILFSNLPDSISKFIVKANIGSCSAVQLLDTAIVTVIPFPKTGLNIIGDTKCFGVDGRIEVQNTENNTYYSAIDIDSNFLGKTLSNSTTTYISIPAQYLITGVNVLTVFANNGCGDFELTVKPFVVVKDTPNLNLSLLPTSSPCKGDSGTITVVKSEAGIVYFAKYAGNIITPLVVGTGGNINLGFHTRDLIPEQISNLSVYANNGCLDWKLNKSADVRVYDHSRGGTIFSDFSSNCNDYQEATLTLNYNLGKIYDWYRTSDSITWDSMQVNKNVLNLTSINKEEYFVAKVINGSCPPAFSNVVKVFVLTMPNTTLSFVGDTICEGEEGKLTLKKYEKDIKYTLRENFTFSLTKFTIDTIGEDIQFIIPNILKTTDFSLYGARYYNNFKDSCKSAFPDSAKLKVVNVIRPEINEDKLSLKCEENTANYTVVPNPGILYNWDALSGIVNGNSQGETVNISWMFDPEHAGSNTLILNSIDQLSGCLFSDTWPITIDDTISPVFTNCPANPSIEIFRNELVNDSIRYTVPDESLDPIFTDNCGIKNTINNYSFTSSLKEVTLVWPTNPVDYQFYMPIRWTIFDLPGNFANCDYKILFTILDDLSPAKAFSPNGDGKNDKWIVDKIDNYVKQGITVQIKVYDRNGRPVWECKDGTCSEGWDGTDIGNGQRALVDSYHYMLFVDGKMVRRSVVTVLY